MAQGLSTPGETALADADRQLEAAWERVALLEGIITKMATNVDDCCGCGYDKNLSDAERAVLDTVLED